MAYQRKARGKPHVPGGYVDVPRHLYDAIMAAPFTLSQLKVVLVIVRLTWGYYPAENHGGAMVSQATIAGYSGLSPCTVRNAVPLLIKEGVVEVVRHGSGREPDVLCVCPDPSKWGRFEPVEVPQQVPLDELSTESAEDACTPTSASRGPLPEQVGDPYLSKYPTPTSVSRSTGSHELPFLELPSLEPPLPPMGGLADADDFEEWWSAYGRVGDKAPARDLYGFWRAKGAGRSDLLSAAIAYRNHCERTDCKMKHARTFLAKPGKDKSPVWPEWADGESHGSMDAHSDARLIGVVTTAAEAFGLVPSSPGALGLPPGRKDLIHD